MQAFIQTSVVGGTAGTLFNDIYFDNNGNLILDPKVKFILNKQFPVRSIKVSSGAIVDGVAIEYVGANGTTMTMKHGSQAGEEGTSASYGPLKSDPVTLNDNEVLFGVFGRAGYQKKWKGSYINNIGFVILDTEEGTTRIEGPFGNSEKVKEGKVFSVSEVKVFGGFSDDSVKHFGLSGLFFVKDFGTQ